MSIFLEQGERLGFRRISLVFLLPFIYDFVTVFFSFLSPCIFFPRNINQ